MKKNEAVELEALALHMLINMDDEIDKFCKRYEADAFPTMASVLSMMCAHVGYNACAGSEELEKDHQIWVDGMKKSTLMGMDYIKYRLKEKK